MFLIGTVLKTEHIVGVSNATPPRPYDFHNVHVLDKAATVIHVATLGRDFGPCPGEGEDIVAVVSVTPNKNRNSGAAELRISLDARANLDDLIDAAPAARAA